MRIEEEIKLDFKDVLIRPKRSTLSSRSEVSLEKTYKLKNSGNTMTCVPTIVANLDTAGTMKMADALDKHKMMVAIHKHYSEEQLVEFFSVPRPYAFYSIGTVKTDMEKLEKVFAKVGSNIQNVCIDVANGYTQSFITFLRKFREKYPTMNVMAGNVVTGEMTEELILSGVDIVKVGIGPGCLKGDTRILMGNGSYKDIKDVLPGDFVINMAGKAVKVKKNIFSGFKKVHEVVHSNFYKPLVITGDHQCFVGNYKSINKISDVGLQKFLSKPTKLGASKLDWLPVTDFEKTCALLPKHIQWDLPTELNVSIEGKKLEASYDLGYLLGYFLGDGHSVVHDIKRSNTFTQKYRRLHFYYHSDDSHKIEKMNEILNKIVGKEMTVKKAKDKNMFMGTIYSTVWAEFLNNFGKRKDKHLPLSLMCLNKDYNLGLYDGLMDSDGHIKEKGRPLGSFTNSSENLMELFSFLSYEKYGYIANYKKHGENAYRTYVPNSHHAKFVDDYQIVKLKHKKFKSESSIEIPVYDLEIDDDTHSFIANNMIVHNSFCTTRKMTGIGYPQLSSIIECADAAHGVGGLVCGDGGCTVPGDVVKAFGGGADFVMMGGMFSGYDECEADVIEKDGQKFLKTYGMSSKDAMAKHSGGVAEYRASEGKTVLIPYRGSVQQVVQDVLGGLRSACTYVGAKTLKELPKRTTFIRVTQQLNEIWGKS